jgi:hypothetical protein
MASKILGQSTDPELKNKTSCGKTRWPRPNKEKQHTNLYELMQDTANLVLVPAPEKKKGDSEGKQRGFLREHDDTAEELIVESQRLGRLPKPVITTGGTKEGKE